jgi:hypothetical protein
MYFSPSPTPLWQRICCCSGVAVVSFSFFLTGCRENTSTAVLERRIERLQSDVNRLKKLTDEAIVLSESSGTDTDQRLEMAEQRSQEALTQTAAAAADQAARFERIENALSTVMRIKEESEAMAHLSPDIEGHQTLQTKHGTFLVRLENLEKNESGSGFTATLNIGNPLGLTIQDFVLKGEFGSPAPQLEPGEAYGDYSTRLDAWQKTLTPFEESLVAPLKANAWTQVELPLAATNFAAVELIRVAMVVKRAHLENQEGTGKFSVINAASDAANLVQTDYGPFLVTVTGMHSEGSKTRVHLLVGNPYGFIVNTSRISGEFGPTPPKRMEAESPSKYAQRLQHWADQMAPFESNLAGTLAALRWSKASFTVPSTDQAKIKYIRSQIKVENVTLPRPSD